MPVTADDIVFYGSATMAENDVTTNIGGAVDTTAKVVFTDISATGVVTAVSDNVADTTQTLTVTGRDASGVIVSDIITLAGTTPVSTTQAFERIMKMVLSAATTGIVSVTDSAAAAVATFEPGVLQVRRIFYDVAADATGGVIRRYYEKIFSRNNNATLALTNAVISEQSDLTGKVAFALESVLDGTDTNGIGNNRQVAPTGYVFDSLAKNVANTQNHSPGSAQGIWLELTLNPGDVATKTVYTLRESGTSV